MKHPTIKQLDFVISKLKSVKKQASKQGAFDIRTPRVYLKAILKKYRHECGTVHCVGGWYAVANLGREFIKSKQEEGLIEFDDGADLMAMDLGFSRLEELENWAHNNPHIWGNQNGAGMFANHESYNNPGYAGVVKQFELVRSNLIKLKGEKQWKKQ